VAERERDETDLSDDELEQQDGGPLPDREAMSIVTPGPDPIPLPWDPDVWTNDPVPRD
jgi:hypothetical protein